MQLNKVGQYLTEKEKARRKQAHKDRLSKIKNRESFFVSSDSLKPLVMNARKKISQAAHEKVLEKQNKLMLERISKIMTAPPKVTDEDYIKMKKLCNSLKTEKESFEQKIITKRNKDFFKSLQKIDSYYHKEDWERDYKRQLNMQRFMRQVSYEKQSTIDEPLSFESLSKLKNETDVPSTAPASTSHVNNIRSLKQKAPHSADSVSNNKKNSIIGNDDLCRPESRHMNSRSDEVNQMNSMAGLFSNASNTEKHNISENVDEYDWDDEFEEKSEKSSKQVSSDVPLGGRVGAEAPTANNEQSLMSHELKSAIEDIFRSNPETNSEPVVPLYFPNEIKYDDKYEAIRINYVHNGSEKHVIERPVTVNFIPSVVTVSLNNDKHTTSVRGSKPSKESTKGSMQLMKNMTQPVSESLDSTITIQSLDDGNMAEIQINFKVKSNILKSNNVSAINVDQVVSTCINLPSILFADDSLKHEYFANLAQGVKIEYMINSKPAIVL